MRRIKEIKKKKMINAIRIPKIKNRVIAVMKLLIQKRMMIAQKKKVATIARVAEMIATKVVIIKVAVAMIPTAGDNISEKFRGKSTAVLTSVDFLLFIIHHEYN